MHQAFGEKQGIRRIKEYSIREHEKRADIRGIGAQVFCLQILQNGIVRKKGEERAVPLRTDRPERTGLTRQIAAAVEVTR